MTITSRARRLRGRLVALLAVPALAACGGVVSTTGDAGDDAATDTAADVPADTPIDTSPDTTADAPPPGCEPMDARATGPCAAIVPGVTWTGRTCEPLGSGCSCEGDDCGAVYATLEECVSHRRGCYDVSCAPAVVADDRCVDCTAEVLLGVYWSGMGCTELWGCQCAGDGCGRRYASVAECELLHGHCDATLCTETGGDWYPGHMCGPCGHFRCGIAPPEDCCSEGCDCGPGRSFAAGVGCAEDPTCTAEQACTASHGTWHPIEECRCEFRCGEELLCTDCMEACDCGPARVFDEERGCVFDESECGPPTQQALCEATGGRWTVGEGCGHFTCGRPNLLEPCVMPGCDCGPHASFVSGEGCVVDELCTMPGPGEPCAGASTSSSCRPGLACCELCGVPPGCPTCQTPCCAMSESCVDGCLPPPP